MQFGGPGFIRGGMKERITSFHELPRFLTEARSLGSNIVYLVEYWDGGYLNMGDFQPYPELGGPEALKAGIHALHEQGGRIILYLCGFVVHRTRSEVGRRFGAQWAIQHHDGRYHGYQNTGEDYFQMWSGSGSGWADYLANLSAGLVRDFDVDGIYLDCYGCESGWQDHHPDHPGGLEPGEFDRRTTDLLHQVRCSVRQAKGDAVVFMEGCELEDQLAAVDGAQDWTLAVLQKRPWQRQPPCKILTAEFDLPSMERILAMGHSISLAAWWLQGLPDEQMLDRLRNVSLDALREQDLDPGREWYVSWAATRGLVRDLWWCFNVLWANGLASVRKPDGQVAGLRGSMEWLRTTLRPFPFPADPFLWTDEGKARWRDTVAAVLANLALLDRSKARTPGDYLRTLVTRAESGMLAN
jgi:hypothetical protein